MLIAILVLAALAAVGFFAWKSSQPTPIMKIKDGAHTAVEVVKKAADVNNDGKVTVADAVAVAKNVKTQTKRVVKNVKAEAGRAKRKYGGKVNKKKVEEA
jgi:hypothetical protein